MLVEGAVISVVTTGDVNCDTLAKDRLIRSGGLKYGEIIIFNRALRDEDRVLVEGDLKAKWGF